MPRPSASLLLLCLFHPSADLAAQTPKPPQRPSQEQLIAQRDAKQAREVFRKAAWTFDYDVALARAKKDDRPILAYFTLSYAQNAASDALENDAFSDPAFSKFAADFVLLAHVITRVADEKHPHLLRNKGIGGVPTVAFLDPNGDLVLPVRDPGLESIVATGTGVRELLRARRELTGGDQKALKAVLLAEISLDMLDFETIEARLATVELTGAERAAVDPKIVDAIILDVMRKRREVGRPACASRIAELHRAGRRSTPAHAVSFWEWVLEHAANTKDGTLADEAYPELLRIVKHPIRELLEERREQLKEIYDRAKGRESRAGPGDGK